jgi:hypothetical protein
MVAVEFALRRFERPMTPTVFGCGSVRQQPLPGKPQNN